ncbi:MAG: pyridoxamine 5'-phosphate oxidase family protein [Gemmobacter sp.]|nr:pyridoxamine 5'-phosphate oxidase family protein [Gemmobacter sp.]
MTWIEDIETLDTLYGAASEAARIKVTDRLIPAYANWIARSRFCLLSSVGPEGTDCSPRGDDGPVVQAPDPRTLWLPDWRGNNRVDTLRNIVRDGRVSLTFLIAGSTTAMRVNGTARLSVDPDLLARFARSGAQPRSVIVVAISEVYPQCAKALLRAGLWRDGDQSDGLATLGDMLREVTSGGFDGASYDAELPGRIARTMW